MGCMEGRAAITRVNNLMLRMYAKEMVGFEKLKAKAEGAVPPGTMEPWTQERRGTHMQRWSGAEQCSHRTRSVGAPLVRPRRPPLYTAP
uniref:Uncharacterized protein n=1 Tax=Salarias fasciatus TaxID=181472 RepID=A0A672HYW5_SALFA